MPKFTNFQLRIIRGFFRIFNNTFLKKQLALSRVVKDIDRERDHFIYDTFDYVRLSSLELVAHEITERNIEGSVAELGVSTGEFAKYINISFPNRKLYLFDTFEGFDKRDLEIEKMGGGGGYSTEWHDFSKTSINTVLGKMKHREQCIIRKGYFPETARDIEEQFVFVSIDADLFKPIYDGLCYFYPRLKQGGYIFVHDYNLAQYKGTKEAVKKFSKEFSAPYFPLTDDSGSAVFMK